MIDRARMMLAMAMLETLFGEDAALVLIASAGPDTAEDRRAHYISNAYRPDVRNMLAELQEQLRTADASLVLQ